MGQGNNERTPCGTRMLKSDNSIYETCERGFPIKEGEIHEVISGLGFSGRPNQD